MAASDAVPTETSISQRSCVWGKCQGGHLYQLSLLHYYTGHCLHSSRGMLIQLVVYGGNMCQKILADSKLQAPVSTWMDLGIPVRPDGYMHELVHDGMRGSRRTSTEHRMLGMQHQSPPPIHTERS